MTEPAKENTKSFFKIDLPKIYFILQIIFGICASFWILFYHQPKTGDDVEHLHSAWLIFQGKVPYIDFFQHHNPLLWYLFAPLMGLFAYNLVVFDIVRIISTLVMFLTLYYAGRIAGQNICKDKYATLLAIASVFPSYVALSGQDFRPDNYMVCSFIAGLYYFFAYLENYKTRNLVISFFLMFLTFAFMQKSVFFLGIFGLIVLYLLYKKDIKMPDFAKALILPLIGVIWFIGWLVYHHMLELYWKANFIFNLYIPDVYDGLVESSKPSFFVLTAIAFLGCCYFLWRGNKAARIICILWIGEAIQRFFYFSLDRHYYYFLDMLDAILAGAFIWEVIKKGIKDKVFILFYTLAIWFIEYQVARFYRQESVTNNIYTPDIYENIINFKSPIFYMLLVGAIIAGLLIYILFKKEYRGLFLFMLLAIAGMFPFVRYCIDYELEPNYHRYVTPKFVLEKVNKCDAVLNGYGLTYGIFTKDITYYWNLNGQLDVIGNSIGIAPLPDLDKAVEDNLPRIIYTGPFLHEKMHKAGKDVPVHWIKPGIRDKYYEQWVFVNIFILKEQYQNKRRCRYDAKNKTWDYYYYGN